MNTTIINTTSLNVDTDLDRELEDSNEPLVVELKCSHRIEKIRTSLTASATVTFSTSPVARILRRDWNLVSAKMFLNCLDEEYAKLVQDDADELAWQTNDLLDMVKSLPIGNMEMAWMRPRQLNLQIVHPLAAQWLRAFVKYDKAFAILINAEKAQRITRAKRWQLTFPTQMAYMGFKARAMKLPLKSTSELLEEAGF